MKYPRTLHLPFSPGVHSDDRVLCSTECFVGRKVVITKKMDGENTTMTQDRVHARSLDSGYHPSREWVRRLHGNLAHLIPDNFRICGENLQARHSIHYDDLESYFLVFNIWSGATCLSWDETIEYTQLFDLMTVPVLYRGVYSDKIVHDLIKQLDVTKDEGLVVRAVDEFTYSDFHENVAKWVRPKHVQTGQHWMHSEMIPNRLKP